MGMDMPLAAYKGCKSAIDKARVREVRANGQRPATIVRQLGISRQSVYRALGEA